MAFTGELEHLHIVDIIQLVHTTRKSGIFSVKGSTGESKIVFSNGSIVGANHINDSIRIGTVLVKMGAITIDDLKQALGATNDAACVSVNRYALDGLGGVHGRRRIRLYVPAADGPGESLA